MADLKRYAYLSIAAAVSTIALKVAAYVVTDSVGLLSDACESVVNLVASFIVLGSLVIAARPEDKEHTFGHNKIEYFASAIEGVCILAAAVWIAWVAVERIINPVELNRLGIGTLISLVAAGVNFVVARVLAKAAKKYDSIALEADSKHLMVDVWTSVAVIAGIIAVCFTKIHLLDPIIALVVTGNIVFSGCFLLMRSYQGLMDAAIADEEIKVIEDIMQKYTEKNGVEFHAFRTRQAASRRFASFHILVPGDMKVSEAHDLVEEIEAEIRAAINKITLSIHIEPIEDECAYRDEGLDRE